MYVCVCLYTGVYDILVIHPLLVTLLSASLNTSIETIHTHTHAVLFATVLVKVLERFAHPKSCTRIA